jgi:uncharacterized protein (DUF2236 family)
VNSRCLLSVLVDESAQGCRSSADWLDRTMTEPDAATSAKELVDVADTLFGTVIGPRRPDPGAPTAHASEMPNDAGDGGFFGPGSVAWRVSADLAAPVAALRSLLMQALHPLAMAGADQHSAWRRDPVGRLTATMTYLATVTCRPYAAGDPALPLWVHGVLVDSALAAGSLVGTALSAADSDRYVAEMVTAAELIGVPRSLVPSSVPELNLYIASVRPRLHRTAAAAEAMGYLLEPPGLDEDAAEIWPDVRDAAVAVLPRWARQVYGFSAPAPLTPGRRTEIRQSLGVLDAMFLSRTGRRTV